MNRATLLSITGVSALCLGGIILLTDPSPVAVTAVIILAALGTYSTTALVLSPRRSLLAALFVLVLVSLNSAVGFDLMNTALLLCFIIGMDRLLS